MSLDCSITELLKSDFSTLWRCKMEGETVEVSTPYPMPDSTFLSLFLTQRGNRYIACDGGRLWEMIKTHGALSEKDALAELRAIATHSEMKEGNADGLPIFFKECSEIRLISSISFDVAAFATMAASALLSVAEGEEVVSEERETRFQTDANNHLKTILRPDQHLLPTHELEGVPDTRFGAIVESGPWLWVVSYISGNSTLNFKKNIAHTAYNFRDLWNSPLARAGRIRKTISVMNSDARGYDWLRLQHRISLLKDEAKGTEPISWAENYLLPHLLDAA